MNFNIISYLDDRSIPYETSGKNISQGWIGLACPFCADHSTHLGINLTSSAYSCWRCGASGSIYNLLKEWETNIKEVMEQYSDREFRGYDFTRKAGSETVLPEDAERTPQNFHTSYLLSRRYDPEFVTQKYRLLFCSPFGDFRYRIIVPIFMDNKFVSYVGMDATREQEEKYKNAPIEKCQIPVKKCLYNMPRKSDSVIVVEGILDAWRLGDNAVATLGTKFTIEQVALLSRYRNVYIMYDMEAKDEADDLSMSLAGLVGHVEVITLEKGDPDDLTTEEAMAIKYELGL